MSATTEHARALAQLSGDYSRTLSQIYQHQGEMAARDIQARGQIWGNAVSQLGQIGAQTFQAATAARQEDQIKAILQKYPDDITKAIPEINKINPELGHKIAQQTHEEKLWAHELKKIGWEAEGQKYLALIEKVNQVNDDAGMARLRYAAQQLGIETGTYPIQFDPAWKAKTIQSLKEAYQAHQGSFPAAPQPVKVETVEGGQNVSKFVTPVPGASYPAQVPAPSQPQPGTPAHETTVRQQELLRQQQGATPAPVPAPTAAPPSLTVDQVERRAPVPAAAPAPAAGAAPSYGTRYGTTTPKGQGFLGPLRRPDGKVSTEISVGVELDGKEVEIPAIVPTLTRSELQQLLIMKEGDSVPKSVLDKAVAHAKQRMAQGKDPVAGPGEQQVKYPDLVAPPEAGPLSENQAWLKAYEDQRAATKKDEADKPGAAGSFEDYLTRYAAAKRKTVAELTTTDIEAARKRYQQADDRGVDPALALLRDLAIDKAKQDAQDRIGQLPPALARRVDSRVKAFDQQPVAKRAAVMAEAVKFAQGMDPNTTNPADDQALLYAFAKGMDPESVVREGEYATVQKYAQSWADTFKFDAQRIFSNKPFLTPEARQNMKATIAAKFEATRAMYDGVRGSFANQINAITKGDDGETYLTDYGAAFPQAPATTPPPPAAATATPALVKTGYQRVQGPNGEKGQVPIGAPLPAGWKVVP